MCDGGSGCSELHHQTDIVLLAVHVLDTGKRIVVVLLLLPKSLHHLHHRFCSSGVLAELVITLLQRGIVDLLTTQSQMMSRPTCHRPLPPPMLQHNYESLADKCFVREAFKTKAVVGKPVDWGMGQ